MLDPAIARLLKEDRRYPLEAYIFIFEALNYAHHVLGMGRPSASEPLKPAEPAAAPAAGARDPEDDFLTDLTDTELVEERQAEEERHVTGQELCEAVRRFALEQYGYMAKTVLANWGIHATADLGELVFNLIRIRQMRKTPQDRREDFHDVYNFDTAFQQDFRFVLPEPPPPCS
jgi:uncharacterized repeat protein (TIGR04138 family)